MATKKLTLKRKQFVREWCVDFNATQAAIRAGYSEKTAGSQGHDLLKIPEIQAAIAERLKKLCMTQDEVLGRLGQMGRGEASTKLIVLPGGDIREEFDSLASLEKIGRVYAMFKDKHIVEIDGLEIVDEDA